jgi:hypothetical protein
MLKIKYPRVYTRGFVIALLRNVQLRWSELHPRVNTRGVKFGMIKKQHQEIF